MLLPGQAPGQPADAVPETCAKRLRALFMRRKDDAGGFPHISKASGEDRGKMFIRWNGKGKLIPLPGLDRKVWPSMYFGLPDPWLTSSKDPPTPQAISDSKVELLAWHPTVGSLHLCLFQGIGVWVTFSCCLQKG